MKRHTDSWPLLIALFGLFACAEADRDAELRRFVDATVAATIARDTGYFRGIVADSYIDSHGNDRDRIIDVIRGYFFLNAEIDASAEIVGVEWTGPESAHLELLVRIDGNRHGVSPQLEIEVLRDGSDWSVIGARWENRSGSRP